jgi:hypothetical protein
MPTAPDADSSELTARNGWRKQGPLQCQPLDTSSTASSSETTLVASELTDLRHAAGDALARGFSIFACEPHGKTPLAKYAPHGFKNGTTDPLRATLPYAAGIPANYGVALGASNLTVVDADHGLKSIDDLRSWMERNNLPETLVVQTGRDGDAGFHLYFSGARPTTVFELDGVTGELKGEGGYVVGPGSIHPSLKKYTIVNDAPIAPFPAEVFPAKTKSEKESLPGTLVPTSQRNGRLTSLAGTLRNQHLSEDTIFAALKDFAVNQCEDGENYFTQEESKLRDMAHRFTTKYDAEPLPPLVIVGKVDPETTTPQGYDMSSEEWAAYDFSKDESDSLIGTETNVIIPPRTKNLVLAADKSFKTSFLLRLMASLASGTTVYDELPVTKPCKVVYIHSELNPVELKKRIIASVVDVDVQGRFRNIRDIRAHLIEESGQQFIVETLAKHKPDVLVLDVWQDLISGFDENSGKDTSTARAFMSSLIDTFKLTLFLVMHEGKDAGRGGRGHSGMAGWRDTIITLKRVGKSEHVHVCVEPRWGEQVTLELTLKDGTMQPTFNLQSPQCQSLITLLKDEHPDGATPKQIAKGLGITLAAAYKVIQRADDAVVKNADGLVCLLQKGK